MTNDKIGLDSATKSRIVGVCTKMKTFDFLFYLEVAIAVRSQTDALLQSIQEKKMTLLKGKLLTKGTIKCLQDMCNDDMCALFCKKVIIRQKAISANESKMPRRTKKCARLSSNAQKHDCRRIRKYF